MNLGRTPRIIAFFLACVSTFGVRGSAQTAAPLPTPLREIGGKELLVPARVWKVPDNNNYASNDSEFSYRRMASSKNFALFWSKEYGDDPLANPDPRKRFNAAEALRECERFFACYEDQLKFVIKGRSVADRYKFLIYVVGGSGGTANGGAIDGKIGALWTPASRINYAPYGALAHELGHSFQSLTHTDGAWAFSSRPKGGGGQTIFEMTSQYMLWQVYPDWMTFEKYHLDAFMQATHLAFLHEDNQYHSPYVLEYWSNKRGLDFVGRLWREAKAGEDVVLAYQRLAGLDQRRFNDETFDAVRRFVTWDLPRVEKVAARYANQHTCALDAVGEGWYRIDPRRCPQNYGYNAIRLRVPAAPGTVSLDFKGVAGAEGFRSIHPEWAGWRYGFLAVRADGSRVYGDVLSADAGQGQFAVPAGTKHLWLVVMGAPTQHWEHVANGKPGDDEQWPYQIRLTGTAPDGSVINPPPVTPPPAPPPAAPSPASAPVQ